MCCIYTQNEFPKLRGQFFNKNSLMGTYFLLKVIISVSVLLTQCLITGIAINTSSFEPLLATKSSVEVSTQLKTTARRNTASPTESSFPTQYINKTWNCSDILLKNQKGPQTNTSVYVYYTDYDPYVCHLNPLHCNRPKQLETNENKKAFKGLPMYGDYSYLPISQWILSLQHGAVVFLYHPCTSVKNIEKLRNIAKKCMWKHIITPYEHLNLTQPIAMVAWASFYADWEVNETASKNWIKNNAMKGPATHMFLNGEYNFNLLHRAKMVSDAQDSKLCPDKEAHVKKTNEEDMEILKDHYNTLYNQGRSSKTLKKHLLQKIKHGLRPEKRSINTNNAAWAVASLLFLCLVLVFVLVYTKPWNERDYYLKEKMSSRNNNTNFSMIKSHFSRGNKSWRELAEQQRHAAASRRLLGPIHEEDEDFMDL